MEQPKGFAAPRQEHKVLCLWHVLYGLKQASLAWWCTLDESLKELGFERLKSEAGIFFYKKKGTNVVVGIIYVDDALFCGPNKAVVDSIKAQFMCKWECQDLREPNEFLSSANHFVLDSSGQSFTEPQSPQLSPFCPALSRHTFSVGFCPALSR